MLLLCVCVKAQNGVAHEHIFSLRHNYVAVPQGDKAYVYGVHGGSWGIVDTVALPTGYIGLDGNIQNLLRFMVTG